MSQKGDCAPRTIVGCSVPEIEAHRETFDRRWPNLARVGSAAVAGELARVERANDFQTKDILKAHNGFQSCAVLSTTLQSSSVMKMRCGRVGAGKAFNKTDKAHAHPTFIQMETPLRYQICRR